MSNDRRAIVEQALAAHAALIDAKCDARVDALVAMHPECSAEELEAIADDDLGLRALHDEKTAFLRRVAVPIEDYMGFVLASYTRPH